MSVAIKKIMYASDIEDSELAEAQEDTRQSTDVEGGSNGENIRDN